MVNETVVFEEVQQNTASCISEFFYMRKNLILTGCEILLRMRAIPVRIK